MSRLSAMLSHKNLTGRENVFNGQGIIGERDEAWHLNCLTQVFFMEAWIKISTSLLAQATQAAAGVIIGLAVTKAVGLALFSYFSKSAQCADSTESIRLSLGKWLALSLEFLLAADILRTVVAPTWNEIGQLAAIIVLRTTLNFFLQREVERSRGQKSFLQDRTESDRCRM